MFGDVETTGITPKLGCYIVRKSTSCPTITVSSIDINGNDQTSPPIISRIGQPLTSFSKSAENIAENEDFYEPESSSSSSSSPSPEKDVLLSPHGGSSFDQTRGDSLNVVHQRSASDLPIIHEEQTIAPLRDLSSDDCLQNVVPANTCDSPLEKSKRVRMRAGGSPDNSTIHLVISDTTTESVEDNDDESDSCDTPSLVHPLVVSRSGGKDRRMLYQMKCQSQLSPSMDNERPNANVIPSQNLPEHTLDRKHSISTPSIDRVGNTIESGAIPVPVSSHSRKRGEGSPNPKSHLPSWSMMTPRAPPGMLVLPKSSKANRSQSINAKSHEIKEKASRQNSDKDNKNWLSWTWRNSKRGAKDKMQGSRHEHTFISASCSNSGRCEVCNKSLARSPSALAYQCDKCDIFVHVQCFGHAGSCSKWTKHPHQPASRAKATVNDSLPVVEDRDKRSTSVSSMNGIDGRLSVEESPLPPISPCFARNSFEPLKSYPQLNDVMWEDLEIWEPDDLPWSVCHRSLIDKLNHIDKKAKEHEIKRQDVIRELYLTEKHHCQTLILMKQIYRGGLMKNYGQAPILSEKELNLVLPYSVLEALLKFHISFLRQLDTRLRQSTIVDTIHDILIRHFCQDDDGTIEAYIKFAFMKDTANANCKEFMEKNVLFQAFINNLNKDAFFRDHSLMDCLLLVTQRVTKYSVLVESIRKHSLDNELRNMEEAERVIKKFIMRVDDGLRQEELSLYWKSIATNFDKHSSASLHADGFTSDDFVNLPRQLLHYGNVRWSSASKKVADVTLLLFDDMIAFVRRKSDGRYCFHSQDRHEAIIELAQHVLVREKASNNNQASFFIIVTATDHPDMYDIICPTKKARASWMDAIQKCVIKKPAQVRRLNAGAEIGGNSSVVEELRALINSRRDEDKEQLNKSFDAYLKFYKDLTTKLQTRTNGALRARAVLLITEELAKASDCRRVVVDHFVSQAQQILSEAVSALQSGEWSNESDEDNPKPKRVDTFHGSRDRPNRSVGVRRHTTMPQFKLSDLPPMTTLDETLSSIRQSADSLPNVEMSESKCDVTSGLNHDVILRLMKEMSSVKLENEYLKRENLLKINLTPKDSGGSDSTSTLEQLRHSLINLQESTIVAEKKLDEKEQKMHNEMEKREKGVQEREEVQMRRGLELDSREEQIEKKLNWFRQRMDDCQARGIPINLNDSFSPPALMSNGSSHNSFDGSPSSGPSPNPVFSPNSISKSASSSFRSGGAIPQPSHLLSFQNQQAMGSSHQVKQQIPRIFDSSSKFPSTASLLGVSSSPPGPIKSSSTSKLGGPFTRSNSEYKKKHSLVESQKLPIHLASSSTGKKKNKK